MSEKAKKRVRALRFKKFGHILPQRIRERESGHLKSSFLTEKQIMVEAAALRKENIRKMRKKKKKRSY